ncbi:MAG: hypothetical protein RL148_225, partial [Planctomycetota bacterium]
MIRYLIATILFALTVAALAYPQRPTLEQLDA